MTYPKKTFKCVKCGSEINDLFRSYGKENQCEFCTLLEKEEKLKEKISLTKHRLIRRG